jgi:para-nitrobenzyl esterase
MVAMLTALAPGATASTRAGLPRVHVQQGLLQGTTQDGVNRFAGIPFAKPPTGDLRWKPPQPPASWQGTRSASSFGSYCPQTPGFLGGNEDCLYLNVYAPAGATKKNLPVMVWIHGGAYVLGTGQTYDPASLVTRGNAIVVTINYRLGLLGSLALPELDKEAGAAGSGGYSLLDQQAALRWVQQNIGQFGGDARKVTLFGESAGATYTCMNVASPSAAGLFSSAIAQSGCGIPGPSITQAKESGAKVAGKLGCTQGDAVSVACLRSKSTQEISDAADSALGGSVGVNNASIPAAGGGVLPHPLNDALQSGSYNRVPMIIGTNLNEGQLLAGLLGSAPTNQQEYLKALGSLSLTTGIPAEQIAAKYPLSDYAKPEDAVAKALGDSTFSCFSLRVDQLASARTPVFGYEFTDPNAPALVPILLPSGPTHGAELNSLFQMIGTGFFDTAQKQLSDTMIGYWTRFTATGRPQGPGAPEWPAFGGQNPQLQNLAPNAVKPVPAADFSRRHNCDFWNRTAPASS